MRRSVPAVLLAAVCSAAAESPYLPAVGPPALRFASPPVELSATALRLPPLLTIEPRPALPVPVAVPIPSTPLPSASSPTNATLPQPELALTPPQASSAVSNGVEVLRLDSENLTPQMFMQFFSGRAGTNGSGLSIIAPLPFIPPAPPAPSSTAAFETTPAVTSPATPLATPPAKP